MQKKVVNNYYKVLEENIKIFTIFLFIFHLLN